MRFFKIVLLIAAISTLVVGCSQQNQPTSPKGLPQLQNCIDCPDEEELILLWGKVFVDTDSSGTLDFSESGYGIADVSVDIVDMYGGITTIKTDAVGTYAIEVPYGCYTVNVPLATPQPDFNDDLPLSFDPTTALSKFICLPATGTEGLNFGFKPRVEELTQELQNGDLESNGLPPEYWLEQLVLALMAADPPAFGQPNTPTPDYDLATLTGFLNQIEGYAFVHPFQFTDGMEAKEAMLIFADPTNTEIIGLKKELLAFELNDAAGLGLVGEPILQDALINYAESVYINGGGGSPTAEKLRLGPATLSDDVAKTKLMLEEANRGGGGGPVQ